MLKNIRCPDCGKRRKKSHEKLAWLRMKYPWVDPEHACLPYELSPLRRDKKTATVKSLLPTDHSPDV